MKPNIIVRLAALVLLLAGGALLFAPSEVGRMISPGPAPLTSQFLASALLGLGAANWIARSSTVGGIYGRSLVVGNLVAFGVSGLVAFRALLDQRSAFLLILTFGALTFAAFFASLMLRGPASR